MIKIYQIITSIHLGGSEIVAFNLTEHCKMKYPEKFDFVVVELYQTRDMYSLEKKKELASKKIRTISLSQHSKRFSLLTGPFLLAWYLSKEKPQLIHSHTDLPDLVLAGAIRILSTFRIKIPQIIRTIHSTELWPTHHKLGKYTESAFLNDRIAAISEPALNAYRQLRTKNKLPVSNHQQIIYNGCITPSKKEHLFKTDKEKINIAFCGRFEAYKGIDILIPAIREINSKYPDTFLFHIIGNGTYQNDIDKLSEEFTNVLVYEAVPNIAEKLHAFDFILMPSHFEGLGLISIEASFSKIPVIATSVSGLNETLPADWPLKFHIENNEELISIFEKIKNNGYDLEELKEKAYLYVSEKFSHSKMIEAYCKLYLENNE